MELAPLADMFAPRSEDVGPIPDTLLQCLSLLQPGSYQPPEVCVWQGLLCISL